VWIYFRILSLKTKDTSASSWLFDFVSYFLARYKNENTEVLYLSLIYPCGLTRPTNFTVSNKTCLITWGEQLTLRMSSSPINVCKTHRKLSVWHTYPDRRITALRLAALFSSDLRLDRWTGNRRTWQQRWPSSSVSSTLSLRFHHLSQPPSHSAVQVYSLPSWKCALKLANKRTIKQTFLVECKTSLFSCILHRIWKWMDY